MAVPVKKIWVIEWRPYDHGEWKSDKRAFTTFAEADKDAKKWLSSLNNNGHREFEVRVQMYEAKREIWEI